VSLHVAKTEITKRIISRRLAINETSIRSLTTGEDYGKKTFHFIRYDTIRYDTVEEFIAVCKGDMNHRKPKTAKNTLGLNLGMCHHVLNSCCPYKTSRSE